MFKGKSPKLDQRSATFNSLRVTQVVSHNYNPVGAAKSYDSFALYLCFLFLLL